MALVNRDFVSRKKGRIERSGRRIERSTIEVLFRVFCDMAFFELGICQKRLSKNACQKPRMSTSIVDLSIQRPDLSIRLFFRLTKSRLTSAMWQVSTQGFYSDWPKNNSPPRLSRKMPGSPANMSSSKNIFSPIFQWLFFSFIPPKDLWLRLMFLVCAGAA